MNDTTSTKLARIGSIDIMRGIVILLMMMDHVRERFYMHTRTGDPIYNTIEPDLFFTRFATHFCAPVFIFLAGLSAWLYAHPVGRPARSPSSFLFTRGLIIILIEIIFYYLLWADSFSNHLFLQVLWAIGLCMVALSLACRFNYWFIGFLGFLIVFGHNALTPINFETHDILYMPWTILHDAGNLATINGLSIDISYPALPWFGVILLGYFAGPLFAHTTVLQTRIKSLIGLGVLSLTTLLVLRGFNIYGETLPWTTQDSIVKTIMSFLNYTKYPPSLDYILITIGSALILLAFLESIKKQNKLLSLIQRFGSVPMFAYLAHLYLLLAGYWLLYLIFGATHGDRFGLDTVPWIWFGAIILTLIMCPLVIAFSKYKHKNKQSKPWLSYF